MINHLYYDDNLTVLRENIADKSGSFAQIKAFKDNWVLQVLAQREGVIKKMAFETRQGMLDI